MEVRAGRAAGVAGPANDGAAVDPVARLDVRLREVTVDALDVLAVVEDDRDPVFLVRPGDRHDTTGRSADRRAVLGADVETAVELGPRRPRRCPHAELGVDGAADRPPRGQRRKRLARARDEPVERLEALALLRHAVGEALELVPRRELAGHAVGAERATTDRAVATAGLQLRAEWLPDSRVQLAPARHLRAQLDDAAVEGIDRCLLLGDLRLEGPGLDRELSELEPVAEETEERRQAEGDSSEDADRRRSGEVEPGDPGPVAPDDEEAELFPVGSARAPGAGAGR